MARISLVLVCCFISLTTFAALGDHLDNDYHLDDLVLFDDNHLALSFECTEADFVKKLKRECGEPFLAKPLDACLPLSNKEEADSMIALIARGGGCSFEDKVRRAQAAGFKAAVVYGDLDPFPMAGNSTGINIQAVSVSRVEGEILASYTGSNSTKLCVKPFEEERNMDFMLFSLAICLFFLLLVTGYHAFLFALRRNERWAAAVASGVGVMSPRLVEAMPSLLFTEAAKDNNGTSASCYICLQDYTSGDKLRSLPCDHKFHASCVDMWLKSWRTFCPVCKHDASTGNGSGSGGEPPSSERTPLLSA